MLFLHVPDSSADRLEAAAKGKKQAVQPHYGIVSSFDGTTVILEEALPKLGGASGSVEIADGLGVGKPQTIFSKFTVKDTEIVIVLGVRDPQEAVDKFNPTFSDPHTAEKDLEKREARELAREKERTKSRKSPAELDLTLCSGRGTDQIVEADAQSSGATKPPIEGELKGIASGIATLKRASDGAVLKYRLDALTEIRIGMCR